MSPILYVPSPVDDVTLLTVGAVVSITMALLLPNEPVAPGDGSVKTALFPAASLIVPPFNANALVEA